MCLGIFPLSRAIFPPPSVPLLVTCVFLISDLPSKVSSLYTDPLPPILSLEGGMARNTTELRAALFIFPSSSTDVTKQVGKAVPEGAVRETWRLGE